MLWERERDWDCVSRLLDGELLRELTPSLLWLRWATPKHKRWDRERPMWHKPRSKGNSNTHTLTMLGSEDSCQPTPWVSARDHDCRHASRTWRCTGCLEWLSDVLTVALDIKWQNSEVVFYFVLVYFMSARERNRERTCVHFCVPPWTSEGNCQESVLPPPCEFHGLKAGVSPS